MNNHFQKIGKAVAVLGLLAASVVIAARQYQSEEVFSDKDWNTDPAYRIYLENREYYKEYEYLFHAGEEGLEISMDENLPTETVAFVPPQIQNGDTKPAITGYLPEQLADYDYLMRNFYIVHSSTTAGRELMNAERFLNRDFALEAAEGPQVLIYHTHSQETFADYGPDHPDANIVTVGEVLAEHLRSKGYSVIHDTSVYDVKNGLLDRNKAYTYALEGITAILQENPSIQVVLDVHRDGVKEGTHLTWDYEGEKAAQIMFFQGISRTPDGPIEYLQNPYVEDNLAFSFQMQLAANTYYSGFTRKIYIKGLRYNMHLRPRSALIEVGAQTNTTEEAIRAMKPLSELLDMVLQGN